jgi:diadenylate cyclase
MDRANYFLSGLRINFGFTVIIDVLIVTVIFYWVYLFLRETKAIRILYGFIVLIMAMFVARIFNLILLNFILRYLTTALVVAIPIVFQPELRRALEKLGRPRFWSEISISKDEMSRLIDEIHDACKQFSTQRIGALIVLQRSSGLREYIDNGVSLEAKVTSGILNSIFFPKSPLHDGAIIIIGRDIVSASSILPVAEVEPGRNLGTRHRAAIGITQVSDAVAVIVSEETGSISIAVGGVLERRVTGDRLKIRLARLLRSNVKEEGKALAWFKRKKRAEDKK